MKDIYDTGCIFRGGRILIEVDRDEDADPPLPCAVYEFNAWITDMMRTWNAELTVKSEKELDDLCKS